jgi:hypothetical protein
LEFKAGWYKKTTNIVRCCAEFLSIGNHSPKRKHISGLSGSYQCPCIPVDNPHLLNGRKAGTDV